jgi:hypothetical protein
VKEIFQQSRSKILYPADIKFCPPNVKVKRTQKLCRNAIKQLCKETLLEKFVLADFVSKERKILCFLT